MRDRRSNREISPRYSDRRHQGHRHVDRHNGPPHRHKPAPRLVRVSRSSPPSRDLHSSPPPLRDLMPPQSDHHRHIPRDYLSPHQPRVHHSTVRDYHHDIHLPSYIRPDYPSDLSHGIEHQSHGLDPRSLTGHNAVFLDNRPSRSYPETLKPDNIRGDMRAIGIHGNDFRRHTHTRDLFGGERERERDDDRDRDRDMDRNRHRERDRGRDRDTGKEFYRREVPHSVTETTTHLESPIEGSQSSYGHGRLCYEHGLAATEDISRAALGGLPDELRKSSDRASDRYSDLVLDDTYEKIPYPRLDYSRVDGKAYSPKTVRERKVYSGFLHRTTHKVEGPIHHGFEQGCPVRPLHRHEAPLPFEDRHEFHREAAHIDREIPQSPIFPDRAKGLHRTDYSPSPDGYVDDLDYETSHERLMTREHQLRHVHDDHVRDHVVYDDDIFEDDDDDLDNDDNGDEDGHISSPRITVKDRLTLSSPPAADVDHTMVRRAGPSRKPFMHGKQYHSQKFIVPAAVRINGVKKRPRTGPFDYRKENSWAYKVQRRGMDNEPNIKKVNYEYSRVSDEEEFNMVCPTTPDPPEGSEEFNKKLERAFFKYAKIINETSQEKKKFLQPGKGSISCYVCGRQSKEFSETHNLVVHAFHTKKLRTAHLGLHKALCLLMGWNWMISPDESKQYQANPPGEAKVLKQDLILWPPTVVIRDSSIDCNSSESKTITVDMIGGILKDLGIGDEKAKVCYGKPSNNVILVKFPPMGSGFELAEELHNHFYQANRGKEHPDDLLKSCTSVTSNKKGNEKEIKDVLYGYMAGIEDLEYIDSGTKKMYLAGKDTIRSRMVMKARITEETAALN